MKMKAAVMRAARQPLEIMTVELDNPRAKEVLVKIQATGVCHSDLNSLMDDSTPTPTILGHEAAGTVVAIGEQVTMVKPGDKVVLNWVPYCGICPYCAEGLFHLCEAAFGPSFTGTLLDGSTRISLDGKPVYHNALTSTFAEYTVVSEMSCVKVPDAIPFAQASLIGCGVATGYGSAVYAAGVKAGYSVAVFGIGGVGINAIQGAKIAGASTIIACDVKPSNLELARKFGATHTVQVGKDDVEEALKDLTGGLGVHCSIDCSGHTAATESAWRGTRKGGTVVVVGAFKPDMTLTLPAAGFHRTGKVLRSSYYGDTQPFRDFPMIANLYLEGKINLDDLILGQFKLDDINSAFEVFQHQEGTNVGRNVIVIE